MHGTLQRTSESLGHSGEPGAGALAKAVRYSPHLDGLRGIAILPVMLHHLFFPGALGGFLGVDVFFVISGYLITRILLGEWDARGRIAWGRFYGRRALRLFPALAVLLAVSTVSIRFLPAETASGVRNGVLFSLAYVSNWAAGMGYEGRMGFLGHTWSLASEEQFYVLWPALLAILLRVVRSRSLAAGLVLGVALFAAAWRVGLTLGGTPLERLYYGLDTRGDSLLLGCSIALAESAGLFAGERVAAALRRATPIAFAVLLALFYAARRDAAWCYHFGFSLTSVATAVILLGTRTAPDGIVGKVLGWGPLVFVGTMSYSLYLWHPLTNHAVSGLTEGMRYSAASAVRMAAAFACAMASYYGIERPFLKLKDRLGGRKRAEPQPASLG